MKFEIINDKNTTVMNTSSYSCIPDEHTLALMLNTGYKIKLDNRVTTIKRLKEKLKETNNDENN